MMEECIKEIELELFEAQNRIIQLQAESIIGLTRLIIQHKDIDSADYMEIKKKIDEAAELRAEHSL